MRRLLLMTAAALMALVAACSDVRTGVRAITDDGGEARVYLLSGAEVVRSSLKREAPPRVSVSDGEIACAARGAHSDPNDAEASSAPHCDTGRED